MDSATLSPGTVIADRFRVVRLLGAGGMGAVYEVEHEVTLHRRALKLLHGELAREPEVVSRFLREASAAGRIGSEHIVETFDAGRLPSGEPYLVMELLEGHTLERLLADAGGRLPLTQGLSIVSQAARGIHAAHEAGIVHRDVKPENLFVVRGPIPTVKVLDFGISKFDPALTGTPSLTVDGLAMGTPHYMSPEQARGQAVDHRSDIYSLGMIAFELFTGQRPFHAENLYDLLRQHIEVRPPSLCELRPEIPRALESVVLRALEKDPARRQQTTEELAAELRQTAPFLPAESFVTLTGVPTSVPRPVLTPGAQAGRTAPTAPGYAATLPEQRVPVKRGPSPLLWGGVGVLVLGGGMALSAVVALVVFGDRDTITIVETKPPAEPKSGAAPPKAPAAGVTNLKRVEAVQFYPKALELARQQLPGAELSTLSVDEPESDGSVDFAKSDGTITYTFTAKGEVASVTLDGEAPVVAKLPVVTFMTGTVRAPRCTVGKVLERSAVSGEDIVVSYGPAASWTVIGADDVKMVPDDC